MSGPDGAPRPTGSEDSSRLGGAGDLAIPPDPAEADGVASPDGDPGEVGGPAAAVKDAPSGGVEAVSVPVRGGAPLTAASRLGLPRGSRLHRCAVRGRWTLLVPERVLFPCPITTEALQRLGDGTLGEVAREMAREYDAPPEIVLADLAELLADLVERGHVRHRPA